MCSVASSEPREHLQDKPYKLAGRTGKTNMDPALTVHSATCVPGIYQFIPLKRIACSQQSHGERKTAYLCPLFIHAQVTWVKNTNR